MASFDYNIQNPSLFLLCQVDQLLFMPHCNFTINAIIKQKNERNLVVVKLYQRANLLLV